MSRHWFGYRHLWQYKWDFWQTPFYNLKNKFEEHITEIKIRPQAVQTIKVKSGKVLTENLYFYVILQFKLNLIISIYWKWSFYVANIFIF